MREATPHAPAARQGVARRVIAPRGIAPQVTAPRGIAPPDHDPLAVGRAVAAAATEVALVLDEAGILRDLILPDRALARDLAGHGGWIGRPWREAVVPDSQPAVTALLRQAMADPGLAPPPMPPPAMPPASMSWRVVEHRSARGDLVPLLCAALRPGVEGRILVLGRDLMRIDLTALALAHGAPALSAHARASLARGGITPQRYCLEVLAPVARRVGDLWSADRCDVLAVQEAVAGLRAALETVAPQPVLSAGPEEGRRRRALLAPAPGEEHGFGLDILAAVLRLAGWEVTRARPEAAAALARGTAFDLAGFSAARAATAEPLGRVIHALRRASRHPGMRVLVGGWAFLQDPALAERVGADAMAADAEQAVRLAAA